jgi:hypothetical protein
MKRRTHTRLRVQNMAKKARDLLAFAIFRVRFWNFSKRHFAVHKNGVAFAAWQ